MVYWLSLDVVEQRTRRKEARRSREAARKGKKDEWKDGGKKRRERNEGKAG